MGEIEQESLFDPGPPEPRVVSEPVSKPKNSLVQAREFNGWTLDKLEVFTAYFKMYVRVAGGGTYIDAFAGEGRPVVNGQPILGSPLRAVESGAFKRLYLFEKGDREHRMLTQAVADLPEAQRDKVDLRPRGDVNEQLSVLLASGQIPVDKPCFAFLDPNSTELDWDTVAALANYKTYVPNPNDKNRPLECKVELWVLVNTHQALVRLMPDHAHVLDRVMGGRAAWWDICQSHYGSRADLLGLRYAERLIAEFGYRWSIPQLVRDPKTRKPQYYMVHASDHPAAHGFMRSAKRDRWDQPTFRGMAPS